MSVDVTPSELDPKVLNTVVKYHSEVEEARREFEDAKERLKVKKTRLEALQESFEAAFRRLISGAQAGELPLFANQSEVLDRANSDPVVSALTDRLLARGHDVNVLVVAGYNEDERAAVTAYLDTCDLNDAAIARVAGTDEVADVVAVEVPAFLIPQPLSSIEIAHLMDRLSTAGLNEVTPDAIEAWGIGTRAEVEAWLDEAERIKAEKGDALVYDDLPEPPACLADADEDEDAEDEDGGDEDGGDDDAQEAASDDEDEEVEAEDEEPEVVAPPSRRRKKGAN
jgi:hypothetical protein